MGLFDDAFDPRTFGSDGGGLYARLLAVAQQQGRYQPGAGFDAQRQSARGQAPSLAPAPVPLPTPRPAVLDRGPAFSDPPGLGDRFSAGLLSWAHTPVGNPIAALANAIAGLASGQRADTATVAPQNSQQRLEALKALLGDKDAMPAAVDPQGAAPRVAQALLRQAAGPRPKADMRQRGLLK